MIEQGLKLFIRPVEIWTRASTPFNLSDTRSVFNLARNQKFVARNFSPKSLIGPFLFQFTDAKLKLDLYIFKKYHFVLIVSALKMPWNDLCLTNTGPLFVDRGQKCSIIYRDLSQNSKKLGIDCLYQNLR